MSAAIPTHDYRRTDYRVPPKTLRGLDALVNRIIGSYRRRGGVFETLKRDANQVEQLAPEYLELSNGVLHQRLMNFRTQFRRNPETAPLIPALAAIREAAHRKLGMRPFFVQIIGALALHRGFLAEMATGEGKTLTAGLAAVLAGWTRRPCHIVTVNDYLVERDAERLGPLYEFAGLRVGCVTDTMQPIARQKGYACDITYTTSKELLADFLRDRLRLGSLHHPTRRLIRRVIGARDAAIDGLVMRGLHTAIIDEADSVLIDEAVTPLIISMQRENAVLKDAGLAAKDIIGGLIEGEDYRTNLRYKEIELTPAGQKKVEESAGRLPGIWRGDARRLELVIQALVAREFFHRDKQYIIEKGKVVIVDEFTGRPMPQRTWREGMHQAIEAKENLEVSDPSETVARLSFQRFFRCFHKLAGMSGTAREAADEFWNVYRLPVIRIPTNRPCVREHWADRVFATEDAKWDAVVAEIARVHATGRPLLVGTRSVAASEKLVRMLGERGLQCALLNAMRLKEESAIVAIAGEAARITIATNMAGRGTDILLGRGVAANGGLHVIATERHESGRVDRQLFGRSGRQGDPGSAQAFVSVEDELVRRHLRPTAHKVLVGAVTRQVPGWEKIASVGFSRAQTKAQRLAYKARNGVMRADQWLGEALSFAGEEVA